MSMYTVKSSMPSGKEDPKFGKEFYVQFEEVEQSFPLWFKAQPEVGKQIDGEITGGKFKKIKKEWNPSGPAATGTPGGASAGTPNAPQGSKPAYKDNSDGMRQGMCINNAANYVNSIKFPDSNGEPTVLNDREWADTVHSYAEALYRKGDLTPAPEVSSEQLDNVKQLFS